MFVKAATNPALNDYALTMRNNAANFSADLVVSRVLGYNIITLSSQLHHLSTKSAVEGMSKDSKNLSPCRALAESKP